MEIIIRSPYVISFVMVAESMSISVNKLPDHDQDIGRKDIQVTVVIGPRVSDLYCHRDTSWGG